jgi:hypothetical protein
MAETMTIQYNLVPNLRAKLKKPFGKLIQGSPQETMSAMKEYVEKEKPARIISVGDVVSKNLHEQGIHPQLTIIDNKSLRNVTLKQTLTAEKPVNVINPQGAITKEAIIAIKEALAKDEHTHIIVEGEEDLLTLIAVLNAPENAIVIYGQPHKGVVVVKVTPRKKAQAARFLKAMESSKS